MDNDRRTQTVSLGCGTLILIALIVLIFGRGDTDKLEREVRDLKSEVTQLREDVAEQTAVLKRLERGLPKAPADGRPGPAEPE